MAHLPAQAGSRSERGFSLVEVLVASLLLLIVLLGVLPLFSRSIISNVQGQDATTAANFARSELDFFYRLPFDAPALTIPAGQTERVVAWCWEPVAADELGPGEWVDLADAGDECAAGAAWRRTVTVRQFSAAGLELGAADPDEDIPTFGPRFAAAEALVGDADPSFVHVKEIQVELVSLKGGGLMGPPQRVTYRLLKDS